MTIIKLTDFGTYFIARAGNRRVMITLSKIEHELGVKPKLADVVTAFNDTSRPGHVALTTENTKLVYAPLL